MIKLKVVKLGTECRDKATKLMGTVTHWICGMDQDVYYNFQPKGLDEECQPVRSLAFGQSRLDVKDTDFEVVEVSFDILGTIVTDKASGFTGMAIELVRHINGCFHVRIQPEGLIPKKNIPIHAREFDIRGCVGDRIPVLTETKLKESKVEKPSPTGDVQSRHVHSESHPTSGRR